MAPQRASEAEHPLRDKWADILDPVGHPIADRVSAKQRPVQAMAGGCYNFTPELPKEEAGAAKARIW